jgi:tol-pal system protein YbgF
MSGTVASRDAGVTRRRLARGLFAVMAFAAVGALPACTPPALLAMRPALDSLRVVVDTIKVRDSIAYLALEDTRRQIAEQKDIVLSTRATAGSTTQQLFEQMQRLEGKLDEVMGRFQQVTQRQAPPPPTTPGAPDPNQLYDQANQDLTQGRYSMALSGFREYVARFPALDRADDAQYGVGECFFAESHFDSAAVAYAVVDSLYPKGDKAPAALYKRALSEEKLGRAADAKAHLNDLVKRFPLSGEAQLARERLGPSRGR